MSSVSAVLQLLRDRDPAFVDALDRITAAHQAQEVAEVWNRDRSDWSRRQMIDYLDRPLVCPGHQPLVKQLLKAAEDEADHEVLAACLVAFDRLARYVRKTRTWYDWTDRQMHSRTTLRLPQNVAPASTSSLDVWLSRWRRRRDADRLFSHRTRYYLRRRAWRWFRRLGYGQPGEYVAAVAAALVRYRDDDLQQGEDILESWGLVHVCFGRSDAITKTAHHIRLKPGRTLDDLQPSPFFPDLWRQASAVDVLLGLVERAGSTLVRKWARDLIDRDHAAARDRLPVERLIGLFDHADPETVDWATAAFRSSAMLGQLPLERWLPLLGVENPNVQAAVCEAIRRNVDPGDVSTEQCVELLVQPAVPVSRLALEWLDARTIDPAADRDRLRRATQAACRETGTDIADWVLSYAGRASNYDRDVCSDVLDSLNPAIRREGWDWLCEADCPARDDAALWARLTESPSDDIRLPLVTELQRRASLPGLSSDDLTPVWTSVLANVHRGSRQKRVAIGQLREAVVRRPEQAETLLPVLRIAIRSVRGPEQAAGLAAVAELVHRRPELQPAVEAAIPELSFAS